MGLDGEAEVIEELVTTLRGRYPDADAYGVEQLVRTLWATYDGARIRDFIPVLVEHSAREALTRGVPLNWST